MYVPEPPYCTYGIRVQVSCVAHVPGAQGSCCATVCTPYVYQPRVCRTYRVPSAVAPQVLLAPAPSLESLLPLTHRRQQAPLEAEPRAAGSRPAGRAALLAPRRELSSPVDSGSAPQPPSTKAAGAPSAPPSRHPLLYLCSQASAHHPLLTSDRLLASAVAPPLQQQQTTAAPAGRAAAPPGAAAPPRDLVFGVVAFRPDSGCTQSKHAGKQCDPNPHPHPNPHPNPNPNPDPNPNATPDPSQARRARASWSPAALPSGWWRAT